MNADRWGGEPVGSGISRLLSDKMPTGSRGWPRRGPKAEAGERPGAFSALLGIEVALKSGTPARPPSSVCSISENFLTGSLQICRGVARVWPQPASPPLAPLCLGYLGLVNSLIQGPCYPASASLSGHVLGLSECLGIM